MMCFISIEKKGVRFKEMELGEVKIHSFLKSQVFIDGKRKLEYQSGCGVFLTTEKTIEILMMVKPMIVIERDGVLNLISGLDTYLLLKVKDWDKKCTVMIIDDFQGSRIREFCVIDRLIVSLIFSESKKENLIRVTRDVMNNGRWAKIMRRLMINVSSNNSSLAKLLQVSRAYVSKVINDSGAK